MALSRQTESTLQYYIEQRRLNHKEGRALPKAPAMETGFISRKSRGIYTIVIEDLSHGKMNPGTTTRVRIRRSRTRPWVEVLDWMPYPYSPTLGIQLHTEHSDTDGEKAEG